MGVDTVRPRLGRSWPFFTRTPAPVEEVWVRESPTQIDRTSRPPSTVRIVLFVRLHARSLATSMSTALTVLPSRLLKKLPLVVRKRLHALDGIVVLKLLTSPLFTVTPLLVTSMTRSDLL